MKPRSHRIKQFKLIAFISLFLITFSVITINFFSHKSSGIKPVWLGNPSREEGLADRALNVWDLQAFDSKIYLAGGSTVTNAGPIKVWAYNPENGEFEQEYIVEEEAIEHFRVFGDRLYIPAADPTKGDLHKFYRREAGEWQRYDSDKIKLAHVRDLIEIEANKILMVGNGRHVKKPENKGAAIAVFRQKSLEIEPAGVENVFIQGAIIADFNFFFSVFRYQDQIFATNSMLRDSQDFQGAIAKYDLESKSLVLDFDLRNNEFIPERIIGSKKMQGFEVIYRPWNPVQFQDYLIYPVRSYSISPNNYEEAYMNSIGFFYKSGMGSSPQVLKLPRGKGEDVLVVDNKLYVLANKRNYWGKFTNYVYQTDLLSDKTKWKQVLKFSGWNKARSFEYLDGTFYFGLGQDYGEAIQNSGDILSYRPESRK